MIRQSNYMETLRTDDKEMVLRYVDTPDAPPYVEVTVTEWADGSFIEFEIEPDVLRSALESLFGGIYSGEA